MGGPSVPRPWVIDFETGQRKKRADMTPEEKIRDNKWNKMNKASATYNGKQTTVQRTINKRKGKGGGGSSGKGGGRGGKSGGARGGFGFSIAELEHRLLSLIQQQRDAYSGW